VAARRIPSHLGSASRAWLASVLDDVGDDISETEYRLLIKAAEAHDRADTARRRVQRDGIVVADRFDQLKPHPAVAIERDARAGFARIVRQLGLDEQEPTTERYMGENGHNYRRQR